MNWSIRSATPDDVPTIFEIRTSVLENSATREALESEGITEEAVAIELRTHRCGWVAEDSGTALGFSMANSRDGSVFALFVRPGFERRGCGGALLKSAVDWLFVRGFDQLRLEVGPQTRAHAFYLKRGWVERGRETNGDVVMHLTRDRKQMKVLKLALSVPVRFGGEEHTGWLPPGSSTPRANAD